MTEIINWLRENPLLFSFSNSRVGLGVHLFYAKSTEEAKQLITNWIMIYSDDIEDIEKLSWTNVAEEGDTTPNIWRLWSLKDNETLGYLKLVNDRIVPVEEAVKALMAKNDKERERMDDKMKKWYDEIQRKNPYPDEDDYRRQGGRSPWDSDPRTIADRFRQMPKYRYREDEK
jgi:hypothetical protein